MTEQLNKGAKWRARARHLRELARKAEQDGVRQQLLEMARVFDAYARKWDATALLVRVVAYPRKALNAPSRKAS